MSEQPFSSPGGENGQVLDGYVGRVSNIFATSIEIAMPAKRAKGQSATRIGDFILIRSDKLGLLARVATLKLGSSADGSEQIAVVEMLVSVDMKTSDSHGGVVHTPGIGDEAFRAPASLVQHIVQGKSARGEDLIFLQFATLQNEEKTPIAFTPEQIFGRHCAVLGATGGGKSWTVARLIEDCAKLKSKVILFDATGEYKALRHGVRHLAIGGLGHGEENTRDVAVPYYHLTETDLFKIFRPEGESQAPRLRAAFKSLKLADIETQLAPDGTIIKAHKSKVQFDSVYLKHRKKIEAPLADFSIKHLARQVENECVHPQRSATEPLFWGGPNSREHSNCLPMIARIEDILSAPGLKAIFDPGKLPSIFREIHSFMDDDRSQVLRISLEHFSFEYNAREIVVNALGRHLLDLARVDSFRKNPMLIVLDEAHQFLSAKLGSDDSDYSLNAFSLIAKEGRKYALNICLATQRPRDIPEGVLSQMGTLMVHRVINDRDRHVIERACGEFDAGSANRVPTLAPGEAVIIGIDFGLPVSVRILEPEAKPHFEGANYQKYWR